MKTLTYEELKKIYEAVGTRRGWDFSKMKSEKEPLSWDYEKIVLKYLKKTDRVLDIGTGGGEFFIKLAPHFQKGVGIDLDTEMIKAAKENLPKTLKNKISFLKMDAEHLDIPKQSFDIVINRHSTVFPFQVNKVLKTGGYFITQQVGGENAENIHKIFNWPSNKEYWTNFWRKKGKLPQGVENLSRQFRNLGFAIERKESEKVNYWFKDVPSLIFWLKSVPLPEKFEIKKHWEKVNKFIEKYSTPKGIETNQHRVLLVVKRL